MGAGVAADSLGSLGDAGTTPVVEEASGVIAVAFSRHIGGSVTL